MPRLVLAMRLLTVKLQLDSVFRVLEPVVGKINERAKAPQTLGTRLGLRAQRSEWFRVYRVSLLRNYYSIISLNYNVCKQDFFLPSESFDLIFLKARIVILCTKGFEIMDLTEYVDIFSIIRTF